MVGHAEKFFRFQAEQNSQGEFAASLVVKSFLREKFASMINALSADIKTKKKAQPFLRFGRLVRAEFFDDVPEFLCEQGGDCEIDALTDFVAELHFDLRSATKNFFADLSWRACRRERKSFRHTKNFP